MARPTYHLPAGANLVKGDHPAGSHTAMSFTVPVRTSVVTLGPNKYGQSSGKKAKRGGSRYGK